jgi:hypothetical protein
MPPADTNKCPLLLDARSLAGAWTRTLLYEPHSADTPSPDSADFVCWIQHAAGLFVDMRVTRAGVTSGFAGCGSIDGVRFVWARDVCSKAARTGCAPQRDEGVLSWEGDALVEDAALEGDDYREVWVRESQGAGATAIATAASAVKLTRGEARAYYVEAEGSTRWGLCAGELIGGGVITVVGDGLAIMHTSDVDIVCAADAARALGGGWRRDEQSSAGDVPAWLSSALEGLA